jgi:hypothetical protein
MKKTKSKILILLLLLVIFIILREKGIINLSAYQSTIAEGSSIGWIKGNMDSDSVREVKKVRIENIKKDIGISVIYKGDTLYKRGPYKNHVDIFIANIYTGFLWAPLYKNAEFFSTGACVPNNELLNNPLYDTLALKIMRKNLFTNKTIVITGLCSHWTAIQTIKDFVKKDFENQMWKDLAD